MKLSKFKQVDGLKFRNELIYADTFTKDEISFQVAPEVIGYWKDQLSLYLSKKREVPIPLEHTEDKAAKKGKLVGVEVAPNEMGKTALFGIIEFTSQEFADEYKEYDVSIFAPPTSDNGLIYPIEHIALTKHPVVPDLKTFEAIAASMKGPDMPKFIDLAKAIGLNFKADAKDDELFKQIVTSFSSAPSFINLAKELGISLAENATEEDAQKGICASFAEMEEKAKKPSGKKKEEEKDEPLSAGFLSMAKENREGKLDRLVREGRITPAVKDELVKVHCDDKELSLAFSSKGSTAAFDNIINALEKNEPVMSFGTDTGHQTLDPDDNPVLKNANKRSEEAKR